MLADIAATSGDTENVSQGGDVENQGGGLKACYQKESKQFPFVQHI